MVSVISFPPYAQLTIDPSTGPFLPDVIEGDCARDLPVVGFELFDDLPFKKIPSVNASVFTPTNDRRISEPQTGADPVIGVGMTPVAL